MKNSTKLSMMATLIMISGIATANTYEGDIARQNARDAYAKSMQGKQAQIRADRNEHAQRGEIQTQRSVMQEERITHQEEMQNRRSDHEDREDARKSYSEEQMKNHEARQENRGEMQERRSERRQRN